MVIPTGTINAPNIFFAVIFFILLISESINITYSTELSQGMNYFIYHECLNKIKPTAIVFQFAKVITNISIHITKSPNP